jgi:pimeloyl-ACP methyl ester carboxylesterase
MVVEVVVRIGGIVSRVAGSLLVQAAVVTAPVAASPMHSADRCAGECRLTQADCTGGPPRGHGAGPIRVRRGRRLQFIAVSDTSVTYPGARPPDRQRFVEAGGVRIAVHEWGDPDAPPVLLAHGGFDFARTYDVFAPLLADAGWRAVAWDQRGHGDSQHTELYTWEADLRDAIAVLDDVSPHAPLAVLGHSKGGALTLNLADAQPFRFRCLINIDGIPFRVNPPDVPDRERTKMLADEVASWLEHRRRAGDLQRKPGTIDELAERRARMNPRLEREWLRYLVTVGGRHDTDGWRWRIDAALRLGGFGPWRPQWTLYRLPGLTMPFLCFLATEAELMGWGTDPDEVLDWLPEGGRCELLPRVGHFAHIEQPAAVAAIVLDFLGTDR